MNKLHLLLGVVLSVSACAYGYDCDENPVVEAPCPCEEEVVAPAPAPVPAPQPCYDCNRPVVQPVAPQPVVQQPANGCQGEIRTVREPVEVVYKRTTYGTVYEPRHFQNVAYERQSVNGGYYAQPEVVNVPAGEQYVPVQQVQAAQQAQPAQPAAPKYTGPVVVVPAQE
ncbi:MAG: hypothetical protein Q4D11_03785 [Rhodospirillales bacterium]|nr:hypothetical protein [Rhodospirillales bacterium]